MRFHFTAGAQRALTAAAAWTSHNDSDELDVPEVLLGLLDEPECRAALLLAPFDIDAEAVRRQFPALARLERPDPRRLDVLAPAWRAALNKVESLLLEYPQPLELATEHVLLGIVASDNSVSTWLHERGLDAATLEAEVHRLSGHQPGPLSWDEDTPDPDLQESRDSGDTILPQERLAALRAIDAAANRAGEALRVIEDHLRFAIDDKHLTSLAKEMRHELTALLAVFPAAERHAARETRADVGTQITVAAEQARASSLAVVEANFKRLEQSLRSLEEFSKLLAPQTAAGIEQLRYRTYTLERAAGLTRASAQQLAAAKLYVLIDGRRSAEELAALAAALVSAGVHVLQLRDKTLGDRELLERARVVREVTRDSDTLFIVNDRPDLAVLADADGVHVGQHELSVKDARRILGTRGLIGVSTHSIEQARAAVLDGASYIGVGPTFPSGTKEFAEFTGTELLAAVHAEIRLPAFAIGGVTLDRLSAVLASGFTRVAVSGAIASTADPARAALEFLAALA